MMKRIYLHFRWAVLGTTFGGLVSGALLGWSALATDRMWPIRFLEANAWLGLHLFGYVYDGFPVISSTIWPNAVLVLYGAFQWGALGLALDGTRFLGRPARRDA